MAAKVNPIPEGYHTVTPVLTVQGAANLIDFLKHAFDAKETYRLDGPNGSVIHAEVKVGDSMVMVGEATASGSRCRRRSRCMWRIQMGGTGERCALARHPSENRAISSMETAVRASKTFPGIIGGSTPMSKMCRRRS